MLPRCSTRSSRARESLPRDAADAANRVGRRVAGTAQHGGRATCPGAAAWRAGPRSEHGSVPWRGRGRADSCAFGGRGRVRRSRAAPAPGSGLSGVPRRGLARRVDATAQAAGFLGRAAIHPAQLHPIHEAFTPLPEEVSAARALVDRYEAPLSTVAGRGRRPHDRRRGRQTLSRNGRTCGCS